MGKEGQGLRAVTTSGPMSCRALPRLEDVIDELGEF